MMPETSFVYLAEAPDIGLLKIGFSRDPAARLAKLKSDCQSTVRLVSCLIGDRTLEKTCLEKFRPYKFKGEWFFDKKTIRLWFAGGYSIHAIHDRPRRPYTRGPLKAVAGEKSQCDLHFGFDQKKMLLDIRLRALAFDLSDKDLCKLAGVSPSTFSRWRSVDI